MHKFKLTEKLFTYALYGSWILYFISLLTTLTFGDKYLPLLREGLKIYIALFLLIRFNPYLHQHPCNNFDKQIAFQAGIFLITTSIINNIIEYYINMATSKIIKL